MPTVLGEVGDHGHVAEGGASRTGAVEGSRELAEGSRQVDAIGGCLHGHAAASQPGDRGAPALGLRAVNSVEAMQATEQLCFESIDGPVDVDDVRAQLACGNTFDGLVDECIDNVMQPLSNIGDGAGFHAHILPNICSPLHGFNTDNVVPGRVIANSGSKTSGRADRRQAPKLERRSALNSGSVKRQPKRVSRISRSRCQASTEVVAKRTPRRRANQRISRTPFVRDQPDQYKDSLGRKDSNLRVADPKSAALPLGDSPMARRSYPPIA